MPRFADPFTQYQDNEGALLSGGKLIFYVAGTVNEYLQTYFDDKEEVPHPLTGVQLDASGRVPPIFYKGSADVELRTSAGVLIDSKKDVGGENVFGEFAVYGPGVMYNKNDKVTAANGKFYISIADENIGNDPTLTPGDNEFWSEIRFIEIYNLESTYDIGRIVQTTNGLFWRSMQNANKGNAPSNSSTFWEPTYDVIHDHKFGKVLARTSAQALQYGRANSLQDASTFPFPLANSVPADTWIDIIQFSSFANLYVPIVQCAGSDLLEINGATDTQFQFNRGKLTAIRFVSDGTSRWKA